MMTYPLKKEEEEITHCFAHHTHIHRKGTLLIDSSTIDPNASKSLAKLVVEHGLRMVDAPVSGGVGGRVGR